MCYVSEGVCLQHFISCVVCVGHVGVCVVCGCVTAVSHSSLPVYLCMCVLNRVCMCVCLLADICVSVCLFAAEELLWAPELGGPEGMPSDAPEEQAVAGEHSS